MERDEYDEAIKESLLDVLGHPSPYAEDWKGPLTESQSKLDELPGRDQA